MRAAEEGRGVVSGSRARQVTTDLLADSDKAIGIAQCYTRRRKTNMGNKGVGDNEEQSNACDG